MRLKSGNSVGTASRVTKLLLYFLAGVAVLAPPRSSLVSCEWTAASCKECSMMALCPTKEFPL